MTKEELKKEAEEYAEQCYGWCNNDQVTDVAIATYITSAEPREKRIEELKQENKELKENLETQKMTVVEMVMPALDRTIKQRTQAEEIIKNSIVLLTKSRTALDTKTYLMKAEQFLRETDIDNAIQKTNEGLNLDKIAEEVEDDLKEGCPDVLCDDCTREDCTVKKLGLVPTKEIEK